MTKVEEMAALLEDRAAAPQLRAMRKRGLSWKPTRVGRAQTEPSVSPSSTGAATYEGSRNRRVQARFTATAYRLPTAGPPTRTQQCAALCVIHLLMVSVCGCDVLRSVCLVGRYLVDNV